MAAPNQQPRPFQYPILPRTDANAAPVSSSSGTRIPPLDPFLPIDEDSSPSKLGRRERYLCGLRRLQEGNFNAASGYFLPPPPKTLIADFGYDLAACLRLAPITIGMMDDITTSLVRSAAVEVINAYSATADATGQASMLLGVAADEENKLNDLWLKSRLQREDEIIDKFIFHEDFKGATKYVFELNRQQMADPIVEIPDTARTSYRQLLDRARELYLTGQGKEAMELVLDVRALLHERTERERRRKLGRRRRTGREGQLARR